MLFWIILISTFSCFVIFAITGESDSFKYGKDSLYKKCIFTKGTYYNPFFRFAFLLGRIVAKYERWAKTEVGKEAGLTFEEENVMLKTKIKTLENQLVEAYLTQSEAVLK